MHLNHGPRPLAYLRYVQQKRFYLVSLVGLLICAFYCSLSLGVVAVKPAQLLATLLGHGADLRTQLVITKIRLPQALSALVAGGGLAVAGAVMQAILRNPLASPFTLGISHAAAFGAALAVMITGHGSLSPGEGTAMSSPLLITTLAFVCAVLTALLISALAKRHGSSPEVMVLCGVALAALFSAATMLLQFFADDVQLAAMVFWTFGDAARGSWPEIKAMAVVVALALVFFQLNSWRYNGMEAGEETARSLGINSGRLRLISMLLASLLTATIISCLGIIGFVGLVVPHLLRRLIGSDHRFLLPAVWLAGSLLLLAADTVARLILAPQVLPVSVLTAFLGAPIFLYFVISRG